MKLFTASIILIALPLISAQSVALLALITSNPTCLALAPKFIAAGQTVQSCNSSTPITTPAMLNTYSLCACPAFGDALTFTNCATGLVNKNGNASLIAEVAGSRAPVLAGTELCIAGNYLPASILTANGTITASTTTPVAAATVSSAAKASTLSISAASPTGSMAPAAATKAAGAIRTAGISGLVLGGLMLLI